MSDLENFRVPMENVRFSCTNRLAAFSGTIVKYPIYKIFRVPLKNIRFAFSNRLVAF